jgi:hypothetical protein
MQLLEGDTPGKVGGEPGDAFELVYTTVTDTVREKVHTVDPVLGEYIRCVQPPAHFCHTQWAMRCVIPSTMLAYHGFTRRNTMGGCSLTTLSLQRACTVLLHLPSWGVWPGL